MSPREKELRRRLRDDFEHYAPKCLKIRPKKGAAAIPFTLNRVQRYIHGKLQEQLERIGMVRALILKGRQQGCTTYIGGRFYWKVTHRKGVRVFILTHEQSATDSVFEQVERYHEHCPVLVKPSTGKSNAKELKFDKLDSGYSVGTAGTKAVGRSKTIQLFHGSEAAFWKNAATHFAGVVQAIANEPGTEIILETTANGPTGEFFERWQQAEAGIGDYIAIFVPWFWQEEYRRPVPPGFVLDEEEEEYAQLHGCDMEQMVWRRAKIAELKDPFLFKQEYPATASEAFQTTGHDSYIKTELVLRARKATHAGVGSLIMGADPARFGVDRFSIAARRGRKVEWVESRNKLDTVAGANWCKALIDEHRPKRFFIDVGGIGAGVFDLLVDWGYGEEHEGPVRAVNFGGAPQDVPEIGTDGKPLPGPLNKRAEIWMRSREWLEDVAGADIPDTDALQADATGPKYHYDTRQRLVLESKEHMMKRGVRSPDEWDAVALTFSEPVPPDTDFGDLRPSGRRRSWASA